jgi:succinyl-diaminopimelate desuccinylase
MRKKNAPLKYLNSGISENVTLLLVITGHRLTLNLHTFIRMKIFIFKEKSKMDEKAILEKLDAWNAEHRNEFVRDIISLVNIKSVKEKEAPGAPFGIGNARALDKGIELAKKYGYKIDNDDYYSLSFLRPGDSPSELALLGHTDVVPEGEHWTYEPYNAIEKDGFIIGRGAGDDKGPAITDLYVLRALDYLGIKLKHTIRVIWGADEESGMKDIQHYLTTHKPPDFTLVSDNPFPLNYGEKGILSANLTTLIDDKRLLDFHGGIASNSVPDSAFIIVDEDINVLRTLFSGIDVEISQAEKGVKILAKGIAGHAAFPDKSVSAIQKLAKFVSEKTLFSGATLRAFKFIAEAFADTHGAGLDIDITDDIGTNTTHVGGYIRLEGAKLKQNINVRYAIKANQEQLIQRLKKSAAEAGFAVEDIDNNLPRYDSLDDPRLQTLLGVVKDVLGVEGKPFTMGGGTHARKMPNSVPYGPWMGLLFPPKESQPRFGTAHGKDEAVDISELQTALKVYVIALLRLDALLPVES